MKKGQLMSQPLTYIFAILVIGMILVFGWSSIKNLLGLGEQVGETKFINDLKKNVDDTSKLYPGTSIECSFVKKTGTTNNRCELLLPDNIKGMCFADTKNEVDFNNIIFKDIEEEIRVYQTTGDKNIFFSTLKNKMNPLYLEKLTPKIPFCLDFFKKDQKIILENKGRVVEATKA